MKQATREIAVFGYAGEGLGRTPPILRPLGGCSVAREGVATYLTGCGLVVIPARVPYMTAVGGVGIIGKTDGSSRRRGG